MPKQVSEIMLSQDVFTRSFWPLFWSDSAVCICL